MLESTPQNGLLAFGVFVPLLHSDISLVGRARLHIMHGKCAVHDPVKKLRRAANFFARARRHYVAACKACSKILIEILRVID